MTNSNDKICSISKIHQHDLASEYSKFTTSQEKQRHRGEAPKVGQARDTIFGMSVDTSTDVAEDFPPFIFSLDGINTPGGADVVWENIQCFSVRPNSFSQVCHYFWYHGWTGHLSGQLGHIFQLVIILLVSSYLF